MGLGWRLLIFTVKFTQVILMERQVWKTLMWGMSSVLFKAPDLSRHQALGGTEEGGVFYCLISETLSQMFPVISRLSCVVSRFVFLWLGLWFSHGYVVLVALVETLVPFDQVLGTSFFKT